MRYLLTIGILLFAWPAAAQINASAEPELTGTYHCEGKNPVGKPYEGTVEIVMQGPIAQLRWTFPNDDEHSYGIGFIDNGKLIVSVFGPTTAPTVAIYAVSTSAPLTLSGTWATMIGPALYEETLTKLPAGHPPVSAPVKPKVHGDPKQEKQG